MNNEEINLDFLDNIKIDDKMDNNIEIEEPKDNIDFDINKEEEEELDFDLNELISKIDAKMDELNNEDSSGEETVSNNDIPKEIKIEDSSDVVSNTEVESDSYNVNNYDSINTDVSSATANNYNVNELISKIDEKLEELNSQNDEVSENNGTEKTAEELYQNNTVEDDNNFNVNDLINKIDAKLEELNNQSEDSTEISAEIDEEKIEDESTQEISDVIDEKNDISNEIGDNEYLDSVETKENDTPKDDNHTSNINSLFEKVNSNVKEASDIFSKNVEMKKKLDKRFEELKELQRDIEKSKQSDYEEINKYKDAVLEELTSKKSEVEARLNELKEMQVKFEHEKNEFENYKKSEKTRLEDLARENKVKDDSRKEELELLEDKLRRQKDSLDEEKRQLSLDRIEYEADKNELANNMLKFNEIVGTFTDGVGNLN